MFGNEGAFESRFAQMYLLAPSHVLLFVNSICAMPLFHPMNTPLPSALLSRLRYPLHVSLLRNRRDRVGKSICLRLSLESLSAGIGRVNLTKSATGAQGNADPKQESHARCDCLAH